MDTKTYAGKNLLLKFLTGQYGKKHRIKIT